MARHGQRRIAHTGFGGASPGLRILRGKAEGDLIREEQDRENQRQAIVNRLNTESAESLAQSRRLKAEDAKFKREKRARELQTAEQTAPLLKEQLIRDYPHLEPSIVEDVSVGALQNIRDALTKQASVEASEASTEASRARTSQIGRDQKRQDTIDAASEMMANPAFYELVSLTSPLGDPHGPSEPGERGTTVIDQVSLFKGIKNLYPDLDREVAKIAVDGIQSARAKLNKQGREAALEEFDIDADEIAWQMERYINSPKNNGDKELAIENMKALLESDELKEGSREHNMGIKVLRRMISDLKITGGSAGPQIDPESPLGKMLAEQQQ